MQELRLTIHIDKPAKDVFDFTLNPKNTPKWVDFIAVEEASEWPAKRGTIYRNRGKEGAEWSELALTEFDPPKQFTLSKQDGSFYVRYSFKSLSVDTSEMEYYEWHAHEAPPSPLTQKTLEKLKYILEDGDTLRGDIIEESLADPSTLKTVKIVSTRVELVRPEHKTPWLKQWTLHTIEVPEDQAAALAEKLSHAIEKQHHSWYVDFKNDALHYIIFANKVFRVDRKRPQQYRSVVEYGLQLGIPSYQLDFSPEVASWEPPKV